ncbi:MAG: methylaspartate mutase subunit S [Spirochaetes bacterium]|nr:methylaspartate mutase subunit S [Spirochaetota bacterium]
MSKGTVVLGVIGSDCHSVGNRILDGFFSEKGWRVVNLGVMVGQDEFIDAAIESGADAILVSSLYGHGEIDCAGFRDRCVERGIEDMVLYVGGNLVVGRMPREIVAAKFTAMGFDRVFMPSDDLEEAARLLESDVAERRRRRAGSGSA